MNIQTCPRSLGRNVMELTWTSPERVDRSKVNCSWESVSLQPLVCVASEQTTGVAHSNKWTHPCRFSICGEPWTKTWRSVLCSTVTVHLLLFASLKVLTDQLQSSLAGEYDGWGVVLCRVRRTLGGAEVSDGHFPCYTVDLGATGRPPNVL